MADEELRARFDMELRVGGLVVSDEDRERLFVMWADHLPQRDELRRATLEPTEEPSFIEKPTALGGGA